MGWIANFERVMDQWTSGLWAAVYRRRPRPIEVVTVLRRECDNNALIVGRGCTLVPNHFTIELPAESHRQLDPHSCRLAPDLAAQIRRYAAEQRYSFAGPVTVRLHPGDEPEHRRYRVSSRVAPSPAGSQAGDDLTVALPAVPLR